MSFGGGALLHLVLSLRIAGAGIFDSSVIRRKGLELYYCILYWYFILEHWTSNLDQQQIPFHYLFSKILHLKFVTIHTYLLQKNTIYKKNKGKISRRGTKY